MWPGTSDSHLKVWFFAALWVLSIAGVMVAWWLFTLLVFNDPETGAFATMMGAIVLWPLGAFVGGALSGRVHKSSRVHMLVFIGAFMISPFVAGLAGAAISDIWNLSH